MSLRDNEQRILDAIENQFQAEDPQLIDSFAAFGLTTPLIKPVNGWGRAARSRERGARRGRHRRTDRHGYAQVLIILAVVLAAVLVVVGTMWWLVAVLSSLP